MNILVIKQTSLGDVLHSTGHIKAIKAKYPDSRLTLLTADSSADLFRDNPNVDELILFERYRVKRDWWRHPLWTLGHFKDTLKRVRVTEYDLAIDLQGRWKSVLFLYAARTRRRIVKGRWPFVEGFRDRRLHALDEMDRVLTLAGIDSDDTRMELFISDEVIARAKTKLRESGWDGLPYVIFSPFTRWPSKNWKTEGFTHLAAALQGRCAVVISGARSDQEVASQFVNDNDLTSVINLCGELDLNEFAAIVSAAQAVISGDSFAMHLAVACNTPVVALFGPTDETRVGPSGQAVILRGPAPCVRCYRMNCEKRCIDSIEPVDILKALDSLSVCTE
ncbi:MAG: lipopolysaccharide heptosyltransferase I [marine bacterium B5-7]|nr:MAG: lipopolysaccharide heptosyltransferase I [marine bacterium B5-7]